MISVVASRVLGFRVRDGTGLGFSVRIESDLFIVRGTEIDRVRAEINLL